MIKAVFFDLDGTLLPFNEEEFVKTYFGLLFNYLKDYGYDKENLFNALFGGTALMYKNNGEVTNEVVFWENFKKIFNVDACYIASSSGRVEVLGNHTDHNGGKVLSLH